MSESLILDSGPSIPEVPAMTDAERAAAQKALSDLVGEHTRILTDALNGAVTDKLYPADVYPDGLPQAMRRVLSTTQIAAQTYVSEAD